MEKVRRNSTRMVRKLNVISYESRRAALNLPNLKYRRMRADIEVHTNFHKAVTTLTLNKSLILGESRTQGNDWMLGKRGVKRDVRRHIFNNIVDP